MKSFWKWKKISLPEYDGKNKRECLVNEENIWTWISGQWRLKLWQNCDIYCTRIHSILSMSLTAFSSQYFSIPNVFLFNKLLRRIRFLFFRHILPKKKGLFNKLGMEWCNCCCSCGIVWHGLYQFNTDIIRV